MENSTPSELKMSMKCGIAGERYNLNLLSAVKKSLGSRPLFKYKAYGQTCADAADVLKYAGPLESDRKSEQLQHEISSEMQRGLPSRLSPTVIHGLDSTMVDAAKLLAKVGTENAEALDHLGKTMKEEGEAPLGQLQDYHQSYSDGAPRSTKAVPGTCSSIAISGAGKASLPSFLSKINGKSTLGEDETHRKRDKNGASQRRDEDKARTRDEEEVRRRRDEEEKKQSVEANKRILPALDQIDPEHEATTKILRQQLCAKGGEVFYKQPHQSLSHAQASEWLSEPPLKVDKTVKESSDTTRLHRKFERKLSTLVSKHTPPQMYDAMQDVIIESSRQLSEYFVSGNYKALVREALISEMQKRCNEIVIEVNSATETYFYAAQRLKMAKILEAKEPCDQVAYYLNKKLNYMIRCRAIARKLIATMKDHIKDAANYLSELVTKPNEKIEAYVSLLGEMEAAGDALLIEGDIPKSYKDTAVYLRQLTSFDDKINRPNNNLQSSTVTKLKHIMSNVTNTGYTQSILNGVITESTRLLVSYVMLQGEKTEALKILIEQMDRAGKTVLLRHGSMRKSYAEGAEMLRRKNSDQLDVSNTDPVVSRKIQIKLNNVMYGNTPEKYQSVIDDVIEDATMYLAVHFLQPQIIRVCKCMKNVFVQCELWCRVARPCCTCSRHFSTQALADIAPSQHIHINPGTSRAFAPGLEISLTQCPSKLNKNSTRGDKTFCPARKPTSGCEQKATTSYLLYTTTKEALSCHGNPTRLAQTPNHNSSQKVISRDIIPLQTMFERNLQQLQGSPDAGNLAVTDDSSPDSSYTPLTTNTSETSGDSKAPFWHAPTTMFAKIHTNMNVQAQPASTFATQECSPTPRKTSRTKPAFHSSKQTNFLKGIRSSCV
ncbi:uncharacterized protein LOC131843430 [Achroia grisella]|uniref:uncharacterized protein LOC131843430 n=1 Tax=Achroia grisella TaxID=688607 RepID=UPI0027D2D386|nr:uncharacterized protein LOC131843430 [Achroia grisella]